MTTPAPNTQSKPATRSSPRIRTPVAKPAPTTSKKRSKDDDDYQPKSKNTRPTTNNPKTAPTPENTARKRRIVISSNGLDTEEEIAIESSPSETEDSTPPETDSTTVPEEDHEPPAEDTNHAGESAEEPIVVPDSTETTNPPLTLEDFIPITPAERQAATDAQVEDIRRALENDMQLDELMAADTSTPDYTPASSSPNPENDTASRPTRYILIKNIAKSEIKAATTRVKMLGIIPINHPAYDQTRRTLGLHVRDDLFDKSLERLRAEYDGQGEVSSGALEQDDDDTNTLSLRFKPDQLPPAITKEDVCRAARVHRLGLDQDDFELTFVNADLYKLETRDDELASLLRIQHNLVVVGLDATVQTWRASLYADTYPVTISNIDAKTSRAGLRHLIEKKCGVIETCSEGVDKETGLLLPWMIIGFKFESQRDKALKFNGRKASLGRKFTPLQITIPLSETEKAERAKKRDEASSNRATRAATKNAAREAANKKYAEREEARRAQLQAAKSRTNAFRALD